jgi:hypothetical protein
MRRRELFSAIAGSLAVTAIIGASDALAYPNPRRARRRIRVRRRIRRHAFTRVVFGRPFWVVPVGLVVGWELVHRKRVVVVKETRIVERAGQKTEVAVIEDASGKADTVEITREDNADNSADLPGSIVRDGDSKVPSIEREEEVGGRP